MWQGCAHTAPPLEKKGRLFFWECKVAWCALLCMQCSIKGLFFQLFRAWRSLFLFFSRLTASCIQGARIKKNALSHSRTPCVLYLYLWIFVSNSDRLCLCARFALYSHGPVLSSTDSYSHCLFSALPLDLRFCRCFWWWISSELNIN